MTNDEVNGKIRTFVDLDAWKEAHKVVLTVYEQTKNLPKEEMYGLTSQMRRSAVSITSNIAEGFSRESYADKIHFYIIAISSLTELQNQIYVARDVNYIDKYSSEKLLRQSVRVYRIISGLIRASKERKNATPHSTFHIPHSRQREIR